MRTAGNCAGPVYADEPDLAAEAWATAGSMGEELSAAVANLAVDSGIGIESLSAKESSKDGEGEN